MRVLLQGRPDLFAVVGGDTTQVTATLDALTRAGVRADLSLELYPDLDGYDLVHVFNVMRADEAVLQADHARGCRRPLVVTPLYWNRPEHEADAGNRRRWPGEQRLRRKVLTRAAAVIVGAPAEADLLYRDFDHPFRCRVVPVGVKPPPRLDPEPFRVRCGLSDFLLCVARISPHKNQLGLCRALEGLRLPLVFVGQVHDAEYFSLCRKAAPPDALFLGALEEEMLWSAYAAARVHALASWFEMPGLTTLEAARAGCNVVSTSRGSAADYLGEAAWFCDPAEPESVRRAVAAAFRAPREGRAAERVRAYTWDRAAAAIRKVYEEVLS